MTRVICICNQKGGVGKTTTAVNLGACFALSGINTLLIDLDPQSNASTGVGIRVKPQESSVYEALISHVEPESVIRTTQINGFSIIPSCQDLIGAEVELAGLIDREKFLSKMIGNLKSKYSYVLIDCPPSLGFLTLNALVAAQSVLIPVQCEYYALEGVSSLLRTIDKIRQSFNKSLLIRGFLLTMFDSRNNICHQVVDNVRQNLGDRVFKTVIPRNVRLSEAPSFGKPVMLYDPQSSGALSYLAFAREILDATDERDS